MRTFSFRPALTLRGRKFKGLRGYAGKPFHPPLTDVPIGAYTIVFGLDVMSAILRKHEVARELYKGGTFALWGGAIVSVFTALTGFWDWYRSSEKGTQARRTINAHAWTMIAATVLVIANLVLRTWIYDSDPHTGAVILVLSVVMMGLVTIGGAMGGALEVEYGLCGEDAAE